MMKMRRITFLIGVVIILMLSACSPAGETPAPGGSSAESGAGAGNPTLQPADPVQVTPVEEEVVTPQPLDPAQNALVDQAKADLAVRLGVPLDEIELVEFRLVEWPDSSLGCPQPGMAYKQVPMDGAIIRLRAAGQVYDYHTGGGRPPFLCDRKLRAPGTPPKLDPDLPPYPPSVEE